MPTTFDKLNLKDHKEILVLNAPDTFEKEIRGLFVGVDPTVVAAARVQAAAGVHLLPQLAGVDPAAILRLEIQQTRPRLNKGPRSRLAR